MCKVNAPVQMKLVEGEGRPEFDPTPFVTYMTDEFTTATEKELNEVLPEWQGREEFERKVEAAAAKPRRGVAYLRTETPAEENESDKATPAEEDSFGEGIEPPAESPENDSGTNSPKDDSTASPGQKRKKRRRGRGRNRKTATDRDSSNNSPASESGETVSQASSNSAASGEQSEDTNQPKPGRKRRRRRRKRGKSGGDSNPAPKTD